MTASLTGLALHQQCNYDADYKHYLFYFTRQKTKTNQRSTKRVNEIENRAKVAAQPVVITANDKEQQQQQKSNE